MKTLSRIDMKDYVLGSGILGCGGGGGAAGALTMIEEVFDRRLEFRLVDIKEIPRDSYLCILASVGGGVSKEDRDRVAHYRERFPSTGDMRTSRLLKAAEELAAYTGHEFHSFLAAETGPGNGVLPMYLNAMEGKPSIDGDGCGRAKPEMGISLTNVAEVPITPMTIRTPFDETVIIKSSVDDDRAEDITRHVAVASGGGVTIARCPATAAQFEKGIVPGQVSRCISVGRAIREAREGGGDPVQAFEEEAEAIRVFEGKVTSFTMEGRGGFNWGDWHIDGTAHYHGRRLRIWYKNEHIISWLNDEPNITCPDLICVVDAKTAEGLSNFVPDGTHTGKQVTVFGIRAHERWKTPKGLQVFGPRRFGFDIEYKPL